MIAVDLAKAERVGEVRDAGITVFDDLLRMVSTVSAFLEWSERQMEAAWDYAAKPSAQTVGALAMLEAARGPDRLSLNEAEAKTFLASAGVPVVRESVAATAEAAASAASELGFPVAVKVLSPDVAHKTEVGGVALGCANAEAVRAAFERVVASARPARPDARIEGVVVQQQIEDGVPIILGVTRDLTFGAVITVGLGGATTELFQDVSLRVLPIDRATAEEMLAELRSAPLLEGFRGAPRADKARLVDATVRLSDAAIALGDAWAEIEANPILVRPEGKGATVVYALVRMAPRTAERGRPTSGR